MKIWILTGLFGLCFAGIGLAASASIDVNLSTQKAYLMENGKVVETSPISSGKSGHETPTGTFTIKSKSQEHRSSEYGKIVDSKGRTIVGNATSKTKVPAGGHFARAPMEYNMNFVGGESMHAGKVTGEPISHGCIRMPLDKARDFYNKVQIGTPITIHE